MKLKTYKTIVVDPPWPNCGTVGFKRNGKLKWESPLSDKFNTMTLDEISNLPLPLLADEDCSLFLWTIHKFLFEALEIMKSWGFKYHVCITWHKHSGWSTWGFHRKTEICLYGYRGTINVNRKGKFIPTLIDESISKMARKPTLFRNYLETNAPSPRLDMFARQKYDKWDAWGNEVESDINIMEYLL